MNQAASLRRSFVAGAVLGVALITSGCISGFAGKSDMDRIVSAIDAQDSTEHKALLDRFVARARKADVDGMIKLTSPITIRSYTEATVREMYISGIVRILQKFPKNGTEMERKFFRDIEGDYGWRLREKYTGTDGNSVTVDYMITRENGSLVVSSIQNVL